MYKTFRKDDVHCSVYEDTICADEYAINTMIQVTLPVLTIHLMNGVICHFQDTMQLFSIMMANLNSILNPIIYAFWYPDFRKTLKMQLQHLLNVF